MSKNIYKNYINKKYYSNIYNIFITKLISQFLKKGNKDR
jgi:Zn/Cd-binding protein ZinT